MDEHAASGFAFESSTSGLELGDGVESFPSELTALRADGADDSLPPELMALLAEMTSKGDEKNVEEKSLQEFKAENKESLKSKP